MRMIIYFESVREKIGEWKLYWETSVYFEARATDIAQFHGMVSVKAHVHGFDNRQANILGIVESSKEYEERWKSLDLFVYSMSIILGQAFNNEERSSLLSVDHQGYNFFLSG